MKQHGREKNRKRHFIIYFIIMSLISQTVFNISSIKLNTGYAEDSGYIIYWNKSDILDEQLDVSENAAGDEEILLEIEFEDNGDYLLEYVLEDNQKTEVLIEKSEDELDIDFNVFYIDDSTEYSITKDLVEDYYAERDYDSYTMVEEELDDDDFTDEGAIEFNVVDSSSSDYVGFEFNLDQRTVIVKWDSSNDMLYYYFDSYDPGNIMTVSLTNPEDTSKDLTILRSLDDFEVSPTQYQLIDGEVTEVEPIVYPFDEDEDEGEEILPGEKPGVEIRFTQPNILGDDYTYDNDDTVLDDYDALIVFEEFDDGERLDLEFQFADDSDSPENTITSVNWDDSNEENESGNEVVYNYDEDNKEYIINIIQDKSEFTTALEDNFDDLSDEAVDTIRSMVDWSYLTESTVYTIELALSTENDTPEIDVTTDDFYPETTIAYTYLEYELIRSGVDEAYLKVTPYNVGTDEEVTYYILQNNSGDDLNINDDLWLTHYYEGDDDTEEIYIPVPFDEDTDNNNYQIIIDYAENVFGSQILTYDALSDDYVSTTSASIDEIDNVFAIPSDEDDDDAEEPYVQKIQFDLVWTAPTEDELETIFEYDPDAIIYYEVMVNDYAYDSGDYVYETVKVFEVYNSGTEDDPVPALRDYSGDPGIYGDPNPADADDEDQIYHYNDYEMGYNSDDSLFRMNDIVVYTDDLEDGWINVVDTDLTEGIVEESDTPYEFNYEYDEEDNGVNYVRIKGTTYINGSYGEGERSLPYSLTLSETNVDIPTPDGIDYEGIDAGEIQLEFDTIDESEYEQYMLYPIDREVTEVRYRVYLASGENSLNQDIPDTIDEDDDDFITLDDKEDSDLDVVVDDDTAAELREIDDDGISKILYFDYVVDDDESSISSNIQGLDENSVYYVKLQAILTEDNVSGTSDEEINSSDFTEIIGFTVPDSPVEPDATEISPISVENLTVDYEEDSEINIQIDFDYDDEIEYEEGLYGFEIISIEGMELPEDLESTSLTIEEILEDDALDEDDVEGWRTYVEVDEDDGSTYEFIKYTDSDWEEPDTDTFDPTDNHMEVIDTENNYNKVYYYYVRTYKVDPDDMDEIISYSVWMGDTITTSPVSGPINLEVEYDYYDDDDDDFDDEHEVVISFDAPIPYGSDIGSNDDYDIDIFVKGEEDSDYSGSKYDTDLLYQDDDGENGYTKFYYLVEDLESNSNYYIKVRIVDNTNDGDTSSFTDPVIARTEFSQDDYDADLAYEEYLEIYEERVEDLYTQSYWIANSNEEVIKYREDYGVGDLLLNANGTYELFVSDDSNNSYYFPSNFIEEMNEYNVDLSFELDGSEVIIRNDSIGLDYIDLIDEKNDDIEALQSDYEDYYVLLNISVDEVTDTINGLEPISNRVSIEMFIVESDLTEEDMEFEITDIYDETVEDETDDLIDLLEEVLDDRIDEDALLEIVDEVYENTVENIANDIEDLFDDYLDYDEDDDEVTEIYSSMEIRLTDDSDNIAQAFYKKSSVWQEIDSVQYGDEYYINTNVISEYIMAKWSVVEDDEQGEYTYEELELISEYELEETIGYGLLNSPNSRFFYQKLIEAGASLAGYTGEYDESYDYLEGLGIELPLQGEFTYVNRGKSLVVLTGIYCYVNDISIDNYQILDYNKIEDLDSIVDDYDNILLIGEDLGLFELDSDGELNPNDDITISELVEILNKIDKGIDY